VVLFEYGVSSTTPLPRPPPWRPPAANG